jgi:hypothetical protein
MRLDELKIDDWYIVDTTATRLVQITGKGRWEIPGEPNHRGERTREEVPCVFAHAVVIGVEIDGHIDARQAKQGRNIQDGAKPLSEDSALDSRHWQEVWLERRIGKHIRVPEGSAIIVGERPQDMEIRVCCQALLDMQGRTLTGRNPQVEGSPLIRSGMVGPAVDPLVPIDPAAIHGDPFAFAKPKPGPEPEAVKPRRDTYMAACRDAKVAGVDVSDIHGTGAVKKIRERLAEAELINVV